MLNVYCVTIKKLEMMKRKTFLFSLCLFVGITVMAQNVADDFNAAYANKRGVYLLPQAGDFAIGIDATPILRYVGNIFNSGGNYPPLVKGVDARFNDLGLDFGQTIYGKYFLQDNRAIRARLSLNFFSGEEKGVVPNDVVRFDDPDSEATLFDIRKGSGTIIEFAAGYEFRRGNGRVQGFYGGEAIFAFIGEKETYSYANRMNDDEVIFKTPNTSNFAGSYSRESDRITEYKPGNTFTFGLGGFAGVEYFFAPQMSIAGEFGLGFYLSSTAQGQSTWEFWDYTEDERVVKTYKSNYGNSRDLGITTLPAGKISLIFHF